MIPKKNGETRPLGLPTWSDKLVGEVVRLLLEAYYEPTFSDRSHGFRPGRGCHTALKEVTQTWTGTTWFIEADIADCFGSLDHGVLTAILAERIHDNRFLRLIRNMLSAGYLEDWVWNATYSGAPQGGIASPVLSNIYLDRLDTFVETVLVPAHTKGGTRAVNPAYARLAARRAYARRCGDKDRARKLLQQMRAMPSKNTLDPGYRRLRYIRYADDHLLGFIGPRSEAEEIKASLGRFLHDELGLELSQDKTLITHARTQPARFLGYDITTEGSPRVTDGRRTVNGTIGIRVPRDVVKAKAAPFRRRGKPAHRPDLVNHDDHTIVATYGAIYRGIVRYYLPAGNIRHLARLKWEMETSMLRTLAAKHRSTVSKMARKYKAKTSTPDGPRTCFEARIERRGRTPLVARFGEIQLKRRKLAVMDDRQPVLTPRSRREIVDRLLHGRCEICGGQDDISVHHIARLAQAAGPEPRPEWARAMTSRRRKTLVVCGKCHDTIHHDNGHHTVTQ